jgi:hypothetical protein
MKTCRIVITSLALTALLLGSSGCGKQPGPAERAGKKIDQTVQKAGQQIDTAGTKVGQAVQKAGQQIDTAAKKVGNDLQGK